MRYFLSLILMVCVSCYAASSQLVHWSYHGKTGPSHWGQLAEVFKTCGDGKTQSPINISSAKSETGAAIEFHYGSYPLRLINTGHGLKVLFDQASPGPYINYNGERYDLLQLHFHTPSENHLFGYAFPMEVHLVHQSATGKLLVIGVFLNRGKANHYLQQLLTRIPKAKNSPQDDSTVTLNPMELLPANHSYYQFMGSLTTPPCTEGLTWIVMRQPIFVSRQQVNTYKNKVIKMSARPIQKLNGRQVMFHKL